MQEKEQDIDSASDRRRVLGRIAGIGVGRQHGGSRFAVFPSIFPDETQVRVEAIELEAAGVETTIGARFFAIANLGATTPEEVQPSNFEPAPPLHDLTER
ncbi:hypothetical protein HY379_02770 [Candidatus Saccharibacteria bacterium]|nr:hypothetical protein [Candidatus Saccharibacteria bacterium]